jgi:uncharacterized protein (TIGR03437 family)
VFLGNGDGTLALAATIDIEDQPQVADLNGDGMPDLSGVAGQRFLVFLGSEDGRFCSLDAPCKPWRELRALKLALLGDVDLDGRLDLVTMTPDSRVDTTLAALESPSQPSSSYAMYYPGGPPAMALAEVTGDAWPDLIVVSGSIYVSPGLGNGKFGDPRPAARGTRTGYFEQFYDIVAADFNRDGRVDLGYVMRYDEPDDGFEVGILFGDGQGNFSQSAFLKDSFRDRVLINLADWNSDGVPDLAFGDAKVLHVAVSIPLAVSSASGEPALAPGSLASIQGLNLAPVEIAAPRFEVLPTILGGVRVQVSEGSGSYDAELLYVSPSRVNFRIRPLSAVGRLSGRVLGPGGATYEFSLLVRPRAPAIFTSDGVHAVASVTATSSTIDAVLCATGLSRTTPSEITVTVNGQGIVADSMFTTDSLPGLDLVEVRIPRPVVCPDKGPCRAATVRMSVGDAQSQTVVLDIRDVQ